jgi:tetratricopeptide (TPR) repeat protein
MKKATTAVLLWALGHAAGAQELHTPQQVLDIINKSSITYELNVLEKPIPPRDRSGNLNFNNVYREAKSDGQGFSVIPYELDSNVAVLVHAAEKEFARNQYAAAREKYQEALKADPSFFQIMTYIGQTYRLEGDLTKAMEWYEKTIEKNYIDYMAHWFLADLLFETGKLDRAVEEITIAKILNRNNPRIDLSYNQIYAKKKLKTDNWSFNPQVALDSTGAKQVRISFVQDWLGYALVKAAWRYEPGYKESMGETRSGLSMTEEKEGILGLLTMIEEKNKKKYPEIQALQLAFDKKHVHEYILYEIMLPRYPQLAYSLPTPVIEEIKTYVLEVRGKGK